MTLRRRLLLLLPLSSLPALAQTRRQSSAPIFRCGPEGREIRDRPCPAGSGASAPLSFDQPSERDRSAALKRQAADAQEAARLQRERERAQAVTLPEAKPGADRASAPARSGRSGKKKGAKDEKTRTVHSPTAKP